jgi:hypothetical protein
MELLWPLAGALMALAGALSYVILAEKESEVRFPDNHEHGPFDRV